MSREYLQPPRGIRDIVGREAELYEYLMEEFRRIARLNGFKPIIPPTIEFYKLFEAKSGEEIRKSMYVFEDKAGRVLALRPEVTASITRIYLRKLRGETKPIRLYYIAQCFRYEEPQYGRYREFWQGGLEIIGDKNVNSDLSVAFTASYFLDKVGVKHYYIVSNVAFHRLILSNAEIPVEKQDYILHLIDKGEIAKALDIVKKETNIIYHEILSKLIDKPLDKLEDLFREYHSIFKENIEVFEKEITRTIDFIDNLKQLGYHVIYDPKLVRGLAYYTSLIYEYKVFNDKIKTSIGGGGRYDDLTKTYGGPTEYLTGLALGLDRIALALSNNYNSIETAKEVIIISHSRIPLEYAYRILRILLDNNINAWIYRTEKISKGLSIANKKNAVMTIILGEREYREKKVSIKNMMSKEQVIVELDDVIETIKKYLNEHY